MGRETSFCPDCGYKIKLLWGMAKCRDCGSKQVPQKKVDGHIAPLNKYCRHCGSSAYYLLKKEKIDAYELVYAISLKEIDYSEERQAPQAPPKVPIFGAQSKAPRSSKLDIVEGEVIRKRYVSQNTSSAWHEAPFSWHRRNDDMPVIQHFQTLS